MSTTSSNIATRLRKQGVSFLAEKMEKLKVVYRKADDLIPYAKNARGRRR